MEPNFFGIIKGEQPIVCNGDDRCLRQKQGGAVGAAACGMRVPPKARSGRREPQPVASSASKSLAVFWYSFVRQKSTIQAEKRFEKGIKPAPHDHTLHRKRLFPYYSYPSAKGQQTTRPSRCSTACRTCGARMP